MQAAATSWDRSPGLILAPAGRQAAWLNFDAPRPHAITHLQYPASVTGVAVAALPASAAALQIDTPFGGYAQVGGDIVGLDVVSGLTFPIVSRTDANESLGAPAWLGAGAALLFERLLVTPGAAVSQYASRIEAVQPDGSQRRVIVDDARQPASSPDGRVLAYIRTLTQGSALFVRNMDGTETETELVPPMRAPDLACPRFSPDGTQIAFMASVPLISELHDFVRFGPLAADTAYAHGLPWDVWIVNLDDSRLRLLAQVLADDGSVTWSPDGRQLFVYGGTGSALVDADSGETLTYNWLSGYGATAWLPPTN